MDLKEYIADNVIVFNTKRKSSGLYGSKMTLLIGYEAQIRPRSGMAIKLGIAMINAPATIDSDY